MIDWSITIFFSIVSVAMSLSALGLWLTAFIPGIDRWSKRFFMSYFVALMGLCIFGFVDLTMFLFQAPRAAVYFTTLMECLFLSLPLPMLTIYLLHCCGESLRSSALFRAVVGLWAAYCVVLASATFTGVFTYVAAYNYYFPGPLHPLMLLPMGAILLLNLVAAIRRRARLSHKTFLSFLVAQAPIAVSVIVNMFVDAALIIDICCVLSALAMYSFILSDQIEQDLRQQREIARQEREIAQQQREIAHERASVMVLRMRPHFIYNTLTSIYCLCEQNPQLAQRVIMDFTTYLRKNFTAIASATPVQFSEELEHTRAYLAVEQAQYEDSLFVEYDTPHTFFRVPPLTLQPIVENCVKHGRDPYAGPFHISIRTRKTDTGSEIIVSDDGRGFHPAEDGEPHIALDNIRQRLETMCGGSLTIAPNEGGGTVVTVTLPDNPAE